MNDRARLAATAPERLASLLAPGLRADLLARLLADERFRARLLDQTAARLGARADEAGPAGVVLAMTGEQLESLVRRAGAVWHGRALARVIDGDTRRALAERLGADTLRLALEGQSVWPAGGPADVSPDAIVGAADAAGAACLAAWSALQPASVSRRIDLLRPHAEPTAAHLSEGPRVIGWVLGRL